jgi:hypothetical protein
MANIIRKLYRAWRPHPSESPAGAPPVAAPPGPPTPRIVPVPFDRTIAPSRPERLLLIAYFDPAGYRTVAEFVHCTGEASRFEYDLLNLFGMPATGRLELPADLRLADYDGIVINSAVSYNVENLLALDRNLDMTIADFPGVKVVMKQDENYRTNRIVDYLASRRFDLLLTCVPEESIRSVYTEEALPDLRFMTSLTGYVSDSLRTYGEAEERERPIDIGYRGSIQPVHFGRLCDEKRTISDVFERICRERGLVSDISSRWEDRFGGEAWFDFLRRIKGVLSIESGASIFDFDGSLEESCDAYVAEHPGADFEEVHAALLAPHEGNVYYNQISPRHFEAAACRAVSIMYEGRYSGIFEAGRHYLSVRRDLANIDEVLERFGDPAQRRQLTDAAYEEIILNDAYSYGSVVRRLDDELESLFDER